MTKENAIMKITEVCGFSTDSIIAFGDDYAEISECLNYVEQVLQWGMRLMR